MSKVLKFPVSEAKNIDLHRRMELLGIREDDLGESYFKTVKSGGKAGLIGVMLFHPSSGIRVRCQRERSQGINRFLVRRMLVEQLEKRARRAAAPLPPVKLDPASAEPPQKLTLALPPLHWGLGGNDHTSIVEDSDAKASDLVHDPESEDRDQDP
ncbi:MAG TPA: peptide chain release factor-like protein [Chthoniobacterales bacterium]|jgi:hypothetical protein